MKIIVKAVAGSHLFGTNTETSDKDFKGVYLPLVDDILLGNIENTISNSTGSNHKKNTSEDIDTELYSLAKFLKMLKNGDTAAIELLFTPKDKILESNHIWDTLVYLKPILISKSISGMVGYSRSQVNKYGIRGSRVGELKHILPLLKQLDSENPNIKVKVVWDKIEDIIKNNKYEHIFLFNLGNDEKPVPAINVLGKKFDYNIQLSNLNKKLSDMYKEYGQRSREASENKGQDFKAISHASRVMFQAKELLTTGHITLPLKKEDLDIVMQMKSGNMNFKEWSTILDNQLTEIEQLRKTSTLNEEVSEVLIENLIKYFHLDEVRKCNMYQTLENSIY